MRWRLPLLVIAVFLVGSVLASPASADRPFTPRFTSNAAGGFMGAANTLMTCPADVPPNTGCADAQAGTATGSALNNNSWVMTRIDQDSDPETSLDSSAATLSLPPGATVLWAGLYYGAVTTAGVGGRSADASLRSSVKLKAPGSAAYTMPPPRSWTSARRATTAGIRDSST